MTTHMSQDTTGRIEAVIAGRLQELMRERGLSQQALSYALEVGPSVINRWVLGRNAMNAANLVMICDYFSVSADWLLGRTNDRRSVRPRTAEEIVEMTDALEADARLPKQSRSRRRP